MHEQWKKRKMFSNREQGIMSGLDPVPMMGGGYVPYPGMQMGGVVSHTHPELHSHSTPSRGIDPGFIRERNPETGALTMLPKMEIGGVVPQPQLFEEGDTEVNDALNMMASVAKPDVPDMPMPMMDEKVEVREEVTEDQGPDEYKQEVLNLKDKFKQEIMTYMSQGQTPELRDYLMNMNMTYANELEMLKEKHGVEMNDPDDKLMTPDFVEQLMTFAKAPGMQDGGVAPPINLDLDLDAISTQKELDDLGIPYPIQGWLQLDSVGRKTLFNEEMLKKSRGMQEGTGRLDDLYKERRALVDELGTSAGTAYKTTEGGLGGYIGQALAERRGKAAAMDKILADEIASERSAGRSGTYSSPAAVTSAIVLGQDKVLENTYDGYVKAFKDFDNPAGAAVGQLALDGQLPPKSAGPIYRQTVLNDQGIEIDWLTYFRDSVKDLEAAGTPIDGESLATIARTWQLEVLG